MLYYLANDSKISIFVMSNKSNMKRYKVKEVIELLDKDGWKLVRTKGDHRQFKHPQKTGTVTVRGKLSETVSQELLNSMWKQAGWSK